MSILYYALSWGAHLSKTQIAVLACIGIAAVTAGAVLLAAFAAEWVSRTCRRRWRGMRTAAYLRSTSTGTCDGLNAAQIADVIEECWVLGDSEHC